MVKQDLGELEVLILGDKYVLRPSFEGLWDMEERAGSLSSMVNKFLRGDAGLREITAIVYGGVIGSSENHKPSMTFEQMGKRVMLNGIGKLIQPCARFIGAAHAGVPLSDVDASGLKKSEDLKEKEPDK